MSGKRLAYDFGRRSLVLCGLMLTLPVSTAFAGTETPERQLPPWPRAFGMGWLTITLIDAVREAGPIQGIDPALFAPRHPVSTPTS